MKQSTTKPTLILLTLLTVTSFFFRFYQLGNLPQAFFSDEAALGYNAWSIMTTGRDEWGQFLPLTLRSFDDYKPAVYSYLTIPFITLLGINETSTRIPAALFGSLVPIWLFALIFLETKNNRLAFLVGLIVAVSPWHLEISRTAIEAGVALSITLISILLLKNENRRIQWLGIIAAIITMYTYHSARIVAPLILLSGVYFKSINPSKHIRWSLIALLIFGFTLSVFQSSWRFDQISVFSDQGVQLTLDEAIREDNGPLPVNYYLTRFLHNKPLQWTQHIAESYLINTSLTYLFIGGAQPPRVTIPETGQFQLILLPLFIIGLVAAIKASSSFDKWMLLWLIIAPLPASLTVAEIPHTYRTIFLIVPLAYFIGLGLNTLLIWIGNSRPIIKYSTYSLLFLTLLFFVVKSWHQYSVHQQVHQPWYRQYGYKELMHYLSTQEQANLITVTNRENEPYMLYLFYNRIHPSVYQSQAEKRLSHKDIDSGEKQWQLFNYIFSEDACPHDVHDTNPENLYVAYLTCELPENFERVHTINFLDGNPEFYVDRPILSPSTGQQSD